MIYTFDTNLDIEELILIITWCNIRRSPIKLFINKNKSLNYDSSALIKTDNTELISSIIEKFSMLYNIGSRSVNPLLLMEDTDDIDKDISQDYLCIFSMYL